MDEQAKALISKYVDNLITPEEMQVLNELLVAEAVVAREFCRQLRMDHDLVTHFNAVKAEEVVRTQMAQEIKRAGNYSFKRPAPLPFWQVVREHLWGPAGSLVFHTAIILLLLSFVTFDISERPPPEIEVVLMEPEATDLEAFEKEWEMLEELPMFVDTITAPDVSVEMDGPSQMVDVDFASLDILNDVQSPLVMRGLFKGRTAAGRRAMLKQYSGGWGMYSEQKVIHALNWLKGHQRENGSWAAGAAERAGDPAAVVSVTSLSLLAFLAHGETSSSDDYGETVTAAIRFIYAQQRTNGVYCKIDKHGVYGHAIATYAVSEAYGLTRIPVLTASMEKAIAVILDGQQKGGGWNYNYDKGPRRDTSVACWQIQALKAAYLAGSTNERIEKALSMAAQDLISAQEPDGLFLYATGDGKADSPRKSCTAMAVLCLQLTGYARDRAVRKGLSVLADEPCDWKEASDEPWALYNWYYLTQAIFHHGGNSWSRWNARFSRAYNDNQQADGSWLAPYAWPETEDGAYCEAYYGPAFSTALATLTMEVYYRFLPTFKPVAIEPGDSEPDDEVIIEIL